MTTRTEVIPVIRGTANAFPAESELAYWLARWIEGEEIAKGEIADAVAGSLVTSGGLEWVVRHFDGKSGSEVLRLAALCLASDADQTLDEWVAFHRDHGQLIEDMRRN